MSQLETSQHISNSADTDRDLDRDPIENTIVKCELIEYENLNDNEADAGNDNSDIEENNLFINATRGEDLQEFKYVPPNIISTSEIKTGKHRANCSTPILEPIPKWIKYENKIDEQNEQNGSGSNSDNDSDPDFDPFEDCQPAPASAPAPALPESESESGNEKRARGIQRKMYKCSICSREWNHKHRFLRHVETHKSEEERTRPFSCALCGSAFHRRDQLQRHMIIHSDDRPFSCQQPGCGYSFKCNFELTRHMLSHSDDRPFTCPHPGCGKLFKYNKTLTKHKKQSHAEGRFFKCDFQNCEHTSTSAYSLRLHKVVHSDDKPFKCTVKNCESTFKRRQELVSHEVFKHMRKRNKTKNKKGN